MNQPASSDDLAELTRRIVVACDARDIDAVMAFYIEDSVFDLSDVGLGVHRGREALRALFEDWWSGYEEYRQEAEEVVDAGNGVVFTVVAMHGRFPGASGWLEQRYGVVLTWTDGLIEHTYNSFDIQAMRDRATRSAAERDPSATG